MVGAIDSISLMWSADKRHSRATSRGHYTAGPEVRIDSSGLRRHGRQTLRFKRIPRPERWWVRRLCTSPPSNQYSLPDNPWSSPAPSALCCSALR